MKAGHFSAKIPGQLSAEINNLIEARHVMTGYDLGEEVAEGYRIG
jgi:hypothetical protein